MKIAIKVLTEWDRLNVIPFFEKHYPNCNSSGFWITSDVLRGEIWFVDEDNDLIYQEFENISDYTILEGVPKDLELPNVTDANFDLNDAINTAVGNTNVETTPTREQELEECLKFFTLLNETEYPTIIGGIRKAKELLNQK